ncbi:STY4851/ECs_5259 family protein [Sphingomicrobium lutaoense]|uniref:Uncharacterized protein n=1 Tax=Sphingomicrobium lutaoense TaxID=515949 RepID=A0A839Z194_9SPHN|nr:STY4851/ECs_5259 family protein [Sphingomicrobium lutaoense]MBB3763442.1 hypothetical protein [Sphingomicrobium lutaoense]
MKSRDFDYEIEAASADSARLRKIAAEIHEEGGSQLLLMKAIQKARKLESAPHPFGESLANLGIPRPTGEPLYRYRLSAETFARIESKLKADLGSPLKRLTLAPAFVMWASDWFRRCYRGGTQRWTDIEKALGVELSQSEWRRLSDAGFEAWKVEPLITAHGIQRLANLARHGGFPAAAVAGGATWPRRFLESVVGEMLTASETDINTAIQICERNEYLLPSLWRSEEMFAICGELALKIVDLRNFADSHAGNDARPHSARLDELCDDWREQLPMTLDGAAADLVDKLLESKKLPSTAALCVRRIMRFIEDEWRPGALLRLDGRWVDRTGAMSPERYSRIFIQPTGALSAQLADQIAYLEHQADDCWTARSMRGEGAIDLPFAAAVTIEFHAQGERLGNEVVLPGGKPVTTGVRIYEHLEQSGSPKTFALIGQGSGAYRAEQVIIEIPTNWSIRGRNGNSEIEPEDFEFSTARTLYRCSGEIIIENDGGDSYLVRTGQTADRRDKLSIIAETPLGVRARTKQRLAKHPLHAEVNDGMARRTGTRSEVFWRPLGDQEWRADLDRAGPGACEFAWLDKETRHIRDRLTAIVLPSSFDITQEIHRGFAHIQLHGWEGQAAFENEAATIDHAWRVRIDPPRRALVGLKLTSPEGSDVELEVPLRAKEWITAWDGELLARNTVLGLASLKDLVARTPQKAVLWGEVPNAQNASLAMCWTVEGELGLSALQSDIAAMIRPLGIDARARLDFHNGQNDHWYVTEFGNELEWEPGGDLRPTKAIIGDDIRVCGRYLGAPEVERDLGEFEGLHSGLGSTPINLPRLRGPWLVYLREGPRILTRPKFIKGDPGQPLPQHRLGHAMAQPLEEACEDLHALIASVADDPSSSPSARVVRSILDLALSLEGLPPQTFEIMKLLPSAGPLAPLLLYRCEEQHISTVLRIFDGLCGSWSLVPKSDWDAAFEAHGKYLISMFDDVNWALKQVEERQEHIASRAPQLAPIVCRDYQPLSWGAVREHFVSHTCERINMDAGLSNPFRPDFNDYLPNERLNGSLMRVLDAPFVAALAALRDVSLTPKKILTIKDVERRHPDYFAKAYGFAISELLNDCQ